MENTCSLRFAAQRQDHGYRASWIEDGDQKAEVFDLALPLTKADAAELRWYREKFHGFVGAGTQVHARAVEARLEEWGWVLFGAIFGEVEAACERRSRVALRRF